MVELAYPVEEGDDRGLVGDVQHDALGLVTDLLDRQVDPVLTAGGDDHVRAPGRCGLRDGESDAGGTADDDDARGVCCVVHAEDATAHDWRQ